MTKDLDLIGMNDMSQMPYEITKPQGPTVNLTWNKPYDLPKAGTAIVKFKMRRVTNDLAAQRYEVQLELLSLKNIKGDVLAVKAPDMETGEALDTLRKSVMKEHEKMMEGEDEGSHEEKEY